MAGTLSIQCVQAGSGAFLVDRGRSGQRGRGLASGGPADSRAMVAANRLLSQAPYTPCLEMTLNGGQWLLSGRGQIALTGADMDWRLNGQLTDLHALLYLDGDYLLTGSMAKRGLRSYLAIRGKWKVPEVLGSVEKGLPWTEGITKGWSCQVNWKDEADYRMDYDHQQHWPILPYVLPVVPGPEWSWLSPEEQKTVLEALFTLAPDSNRQGIRLLPPSDTGFPSNLPTLLSSPVLPGTIQLAPSGPLLLGPDAQTVGGYPRILIVTDTYALDAAFQVGIGEELRFQLLG
ncbi:MAG: biotin-dependent carboxyltransferase family protein [Bacteroidota bacterium]